MPIEVVKGQKTEITKTNPGLKAIVIDLEWKVPMGMEVDASAFLLGANGKVPKDEDFVFYSNPKDRSNSVLYVDQDPANKQLKINLNTIPSEIQRIAFSVTIYDALVRKQNFGQIWDLHIKILNGVNNTEICKLNLGNGLTVENALVLGELYRHNGEWKFNAIGSGFNGGLAALCQNFGIEVNEQPKQTKITSKETDNLQQSLNPRETDNPEKNLNSQATGSPKINLTKIELKKKGETINLVKTTTKLGEILVNLNWNRNRETKPSGGFLANLMGSGAKSIDLDLGCLYELKDGTIGVVQALGNSFGKLNKPPYVALDGDDRTGAVSGGENLRINGNELAKIKRILVYTFIYEGIADWSQADGVVTLKQPNGPDIVVALDEYSTAQRMCAIALIENVNDQTLSVKRLVQFFKGHRDLDQEFHWGLRWKAGHK